MTLQNFLKLIIASLIIYYLVKYNLLDLNLLFELNLSLFLSLLFFVFFIIMIGTYKWFLVLKVQNEKITFKKTFKLYYLGYALNFLLFGIGGDVIKTFYLIKGESNKIGISMSVLIDRLIGLMAMFFIIIYCSPYILDIINIYNVNKIIQNNLFDYFIYLILLTALLFLFLNKFLNSKRINKYLLKFLLNYKKNKFINILLNIVKVFFTYRKKIFVLIASFVLAIIAQILIAYSLYLICFEILKFNSHFIGNFLSSVSVQLLSIIPISPGNIGVGEAAYAKLMKLFHSNSLLPFASVYLFYRLLNMIFSLPAVIIYYSFSKNKN